MTHSKSTFRALLLFGLFAIVGCDSSPKPLATITPVKVVSLDPTGSGFIDEYFISQNARWMVISFKNQLFQVKLSGQLALTPIQSKVPLTGSDFYDEKRLLARSGNTLYLWDCEKKEIAAKSEPLTENIFNTGRTLDGKYFWARAETNSTLTQKFYLLSHPDLKTVGSISCHNPSGKTILAIYMLEENLIRFFHSDGYFDYDTNVQRLVGSKTEIGSFRHQPKIRDYCQGDLLSDKIDVCRSPQTGATQAVARNPQTFATAPISPQLPDLTSDYLTRGGLHLLINGRDAIHFRPFTPRFEIWNANGKTLLAADVLSSNKQDVFINDNNNIFVFDTKTGNLRIYNFSGLPPINPNNFE